MYKKTSTELVAHDNYEVSFERGIFGQLDFVDFLNERKDSFKARTVNLYDLLFKNISSGPLFIGEIRDKLELGKEVSDEAILSTITDGRTMGMVKGSEFAVATKDFSGGYKWEYFLMSDVALASVALMLIGKTTMFNKLTAENKLEALKVFLTAKEKKSIKMIEYFGKVRTFQSDEKGAKTYAVLPQEELIECLIDSLDERFEGCEFEGATYSHNGTYANWSLPEQKDDLLETYINTCNAHGFTKMDDFTPAVRFYTSDVGMSSVTLKAVLMKGNFHIDIGSAIKLDHMNGHTVKDFKESLDQLFTQYADLVKNLEELLSIEIEHSISCLRNVGEDAGIPATYLDPAIELFESIHEEEENPITAHDLFYALEEALFNMKCAKVADSTIEKCRENLARTLSKSFDWKAMDRI